MMRKTGFRAFWLLVLLMAVFLSLTGCKSKAVRTAEEKIDAIGEVTISSKEKILEAKRAYSLLSASECEKVSNADKLISAESAYEDAEVAFAEEAIDAVGTVTADSGEKVNQARTIYDSISDAARKKVRNLDTLETAEETLRKMQEASAVENVRVLISNGDPDGAVNAASSYCKEYGLQNISEDALRQFSEAYIAKAKQLESESKLENAESVLTEIDKQYKEHFLSDDPIDSALQALRARIDAGRPANGSVTNAGCQGGYAQVVIENGGSDVLVKIESIADPNVYLTMYVRADQTATVHVKDGSYCLKYASGERWFSSAELFGQNTQYTKANQNLDLTTSYNGNSVSYSSITITLYKVLNGNLTTSSIPENAF